MTLRIISNDVVAVISQNIVKKLDWKTKGLKIKNQPLENASNAKIFLLLSLGFLRLLVLSATVSNDLNYIAYWKYDLMHGKRWISLYSKLQFLLKQCPSNSKYE